MFGIPFLASASLTFFHVVSHKFCFQLHRHENLSPKPKQGVLLQLRNLTETTTAHSCTNFLPYLSLRHEQHTLSPWTLVCQRTIQNINKTANVSKPKRSFFS